MLNLALTTDKLSLITSSGADVDVHVSFVDDLADAMTPGKQNTAITTAATTDILASPAGSTVRNAKFISVRNIDVTSNDITIQFNANGTLYTLFKCTLATAEELVCREGVWFHYDSNGGVYSVGSTLAIQSDMETGTSTTLSVSPGMMKYHPGSVKSWVSCGVAADIQQSFNVASLTDNAGAGKVTVTFTTNQSAATYCAVASVEEISSGSNTAVASNRRANLLFSSRAVGSYQIHCMDNTATSCLEKDPTTYHAIVMGDF